MGWNPNLSWEEKGNEKQPEARLSTFYTEAACVNVKVKLLDIISFFPFGKKKLKRVKKTALLSQVW